MKKVTLKNKIEYTNEGCKREAVFADTKETAGYMVGYSGEWTAVNLNGEKKFFTKEKEVREWLGSQEEKKEEEMSIKEWVEKFGKSFTMTKEEMGR